jgi:hypothetical protein
MHCNSSIEFLFQELYVSGHSSSHSREDMLSVYGKYMPFLINFTVPITTKKERKKERKKEKNYIFLL